MLVSLTQRGRELREESRCLGETLLARTGMEAKELIALNRELRRLREHLASPSRCGLSAIIRAEAHASINRARHRAW